MKKISKKTFDEIRAWVYRNARQLDLAIWQFAFENGSGESVLSALSHYQNDDGGFGNALEPDCWNPGSSPYTTLNAIGILKNINFTDIRHPIVKGIFKFLESGAHSVDNGWLFSIPSNDGYARAPWWNYDPEANEYEHIGVTAGLTSFILKYADKQSNLYLRAFNITKKLLSGFKDPGKKGDMGLTGYCELLDAINQLKLSDEFDISYLSENIKKSVDDVIVRDVSKWAEYGVRPSQFISSPDSRFYPGNEDIVQKELDYMIDTRPENNVWGITWQWWDNYEKYPKEFAISENWWKANLATERLKFLRNFDRLDNK